MRGKVLPRAVLGPASGITPAYAGKSFFMCRSAFFLQDHPRVCGEKLKIPCWIAPKVGSPPRMRGKAQQSVSTIQQVGITPAYAGKSLRCGLVFCSRWDHPRVCGEKGLTFHQMLRPTGSPPRMRGKGRVSTHLHGRSRITPAYAGKSVPFLASLSKMWDHPRVCGEKFRISP